MIDRLGWKDKELPSPSVRQRLLQPEIFRAKGIYPFHSFPLDEDILIQVDRLIRYAAGRLMDAELSL